MPTEKPVGRRSEQKATTYRRVLAAANDLLRRDGLAGFNARAVAHAAGVAVGTVFVHFPTTTTLLEALLERHLHHALAEAMATLQPGSLVDRLVHVCSKLIAAYHVEPALARAYLQGTLFAPPSVLSTSRLAAFAQWFEHERQAARTLHTSAEVAAELPADVAFFGFFSLYAGALLASLRGDLEVSLAPSFLRRSLEQFFVASSAWSSP